MRTGNCPFTALRKHILMRSGIGRSERVAPSADSNWRVLSTGYCSGTGKDATQQAAHPRPDEKFHECLCHRSAWDQYLRPPGRYFFYSKLVCSTENDTVEIDSRTSDAIALAGSFGCPIYTFWKYSWQRWYPDGRFPAPGKRKRPNGK